MIKKPGMFSMVIQTMRLHKRMPTRMECSTRDPTSPAPPFRNEPKNTEPPFEMSEKP